MNEQGIMRGNIKITVFDSFDFRELSEIVKMIEDIGYTSKMISNGNIVLQKKNE